MSQSLSSNSLLRLILSFFLVIFEVGSIICASSPSSYAFIVGRAIAGLGSAGIVSGAVNLIAHALPLDKRAAYLGAVGAVAGLSSCAAPVLGGAFTDSHLTWRWSALEINLDEAC